MPKKNGYGSAALNYQTDGESYWSSVEVDVGIAFVVSHKVAEPAPQHWQAVDRPMIPVL